MTITLKEGIFRAPPFHTWVFLPLSSIADRTGLLKSHQISVSTQFALELSKHNSFHQLAI